MRLFTWNVGRKPDMLELGLKHLSAGGRPFIGAFQEAPSDRFDDIELAGRGWQMSRIAVLPSTTGKGMARVVVYASSDVTVTRIVSHESFRSIALQAEILGRLVWLFAIHAPDLRNFPFGSVERQLFSGNYRGFIRDVAGTSNDNGVVVVGDLNANPYAAEILSAGGMWAVFDKSDLSLRKKIVVGSKDVFISPFFSPMWSCMLGGPLAGIGSYRMPGAWHRWHWIDQIIVSADLADNSGTPTIHTSLGGRKLVTKKGAPGAKGASDHLPVEMVLR